MDLVAVDPHFNLYDNEWPMRTYQASILPKFVFAQEYGGGWALHSIPSFAAGDSQRGRVQNSSFPECKDQ